MMLENIILAIILIILAPAVLILVFAAMCEIFRDLTG